MFTGIAEEIGKIENIKRNSKALELTISCKKVLEDIKIGDSIMTDGLCLTVKSFASNYFLADLMKESEESSKFKNNYLNEFVNLERAIKVGDRLDGHIVQGHVDGIGKIIGINKNVYRIKTNREISKYIVKKGSIAVDGISLTVSFASDDYFEVSLIPESLANTTFKYKKINQFVNLESDILMRFLEKQVKSQKKEERMDRNFLLANGF